MLSYIGGKKFQAKFISSKFPHNFRNYVEPFSGAFWVYFISGLNKIMDHVVYNDINPYMVNIFYCASHDPEKLYDIMEQNNAQQYDLFIQYRDEIFTRGIDKKIEMPDFDLAMKYLYLQTQIFAGNTLDEKTKMTDLKGKYRSKYYHFQDKLRDNYYLRMLSQITDFENLSFEKIIEKYDSKETLFYLDPPYYKMENYYTFSKCDHEKLASILKNIHGKFILSYYDFSLLDQWFQKDKYVRIYRNYNSQNGNRLKNESSERTELLILNY